MARVRAGPSAWNVIALVGRDVPRTARGAVVVACSGPHIVPLVMATVALVGIDEPGH